MIAVMADDLDAQRPGTAAGPLVVSQANPRYFTIAPGPAGAGRAVYPYFSMGTQSLGVTEILVLICKG